MTDSERVIYIQVWGIKGVAKQRVAISQLNRAEKDGKKNPEKSRKSGKNSKKYKKNNKSGKNLKNPIQWSLIC